MAALAAMGHLYSMPESRDIVIRNRERPERPAIPQKVFKRSDPSYRRMPVTTEDHQRVAAAAARRERRAAKRHQDYLQCLASNPCLRNAV
jgi:hypothetical protein